MLSGNPSRSRGPGSSSRKKSASCSSKDRSPFGTILIGRWSESDCADVERNWCRFLRGAGVELTAMATGPMAGDGFRDGLEKCRRSSAMSRAVVYRSDARFDMRLEADPFQFLGDRVIDLAGGRASAVAIWSSSSSRASLPADERSSPGQQLVENDAQAEDVGAAIDPMPLATGLLGTHVRRSSGNPAPLPKSSSLQCQTEVGDERLARGDRSGCWRA